MTPKEAKELSLEVWRYLAEHPEIDKKEGLPEKLWLQIKDLHNKCPLCHIFQGVFCVFNCPLKSCYTGDKSTDWYWWYYGNLNARQNAAESIVAKIEAWEV